MDKKGLSVIAFSAAVFLTGCSAHEVDPEASEPTVTEAPMTTPFAEVKDAEPVFPEQLDQPEKDPGLNVTWTLQTVTSAPVSGNAVVNLLVRNDNEAPLSPEQIPQPTLKVAEGSDENNLTEVEPESNEASGITNGLDLPLGSGASANIQYAFKTSSANLWSAELTTGNVVWKGKLR